MYRDNRVHHLPISWAVNAMQSVTFFNIDSFISLLRFFFYAQCCFFAMIIALFLDLPRCVRKFKWRTLLCDDWREAKKNVALEFCLLLKFTADATAFVVGTWNCVECCFWNCAACAQTTTTKNLKILIKQCDDSFKNQCNKCTSCMCVQSAHSGALHSRTIRIQCEQQITWWTCVFD